MRGTHTCTHRDREKNTYLTGDGYFRAVFIANGAAAAIIVGEDNGDGGLGDTRLALLVHQFLEIGDAHLLQVGDAHDEANAVQDVGLTGAIVARDGVEARVEAAHRRPRRVRLEAFQTYLLYVHPKPSSQTQVHQKQPKKKKQTIQNSNTNSNNYAPTSGIKITTRQQQSTRNHNDKKNSDQSKHPQHPRKSLPERRAGRRKGSNGGPSRRGRHSATQCSHFPSRNDGIRFADSSLLITAWNKPLIAYYFYY